MSSTQLILADPANPTHGQAIVSLLDTYASSFEGGGIGLSQLTKSNLPTALANHPTSEVILALIDGSPAGLIVAFLGFSTFQCRPLLNIHDVIVHPDYRRKGISKLLLARTEERGRELNCCKLTLEVLEENHVAKNAYATFGFNSYELDPSLGKAMFWEKKI